MKVQDIFKKADTEMVFNAYGLIEPFFGDMETHMIQEQAQACVQPSEGTL